MPQNDRDDEIDLLSRKSLLNINPTEVYSNSHNTPVIKRPTDSTLQTRGWVGVPGDDGIHVLQELSDHETDAAGCGTGDDMEEQWLAIQFAHDRPMPAPGNGLTPKEADRLISKCPRYKADTLKPSEDQNKRLNVRQQIILCNVHKLKDAETE